jgi:hypothetical protein
MSETVSALSKLRIGTKAILWFVLIVFAALGLGIVLALPWWMVALLGLAGVVLGAIPFLPVWLFKRADPAWSGKLTFAKYALAGILAVVGLAGIPFFYAIYAVDSGPASMPLATLSNGKKTVVFQGMQHIGSEGYYKGVVFDLEKALADGYTLFYEGVQPAPGRPDLDDWFFKEFMGSTTDLSTGYQKLANQCGLTFQLSYFEPLLADKAIHPKKHITADVTTLDLRNEYDRLMREDPAFAAFMNTARAKKQEIKSDPMLWVLSLADAASPAQKKLMGILCRGVLATAMSSEANAADLKERIILLYRNKVLARMVSESPASKIYITYGGKHFRGFVQDLKAIDPSFEVVALSWGRAMASPKEVSPPEGDWSALLKPVSR